MEELEMLETTNETENVDTQTTEEIVEGEVITTESSDEGNITSLRDILEQNPAYKEEFNEMMQTRLRRKDREHKREMSKLRDIENVLKSTIGGDSTEEIRMNLRNAYSNEGVDLPEYDTGLSSEELEVLAKHEVEQIAKDGYEAMVEEANRLATIKYENLGAKDKIIFTELARRVTREDERKALLSIGVSESVLKDKAFEEFRKQFNTNVPIKEVYALYKLKQPKEEISNPGSMRNVKTPNAKTIFTDEDIAKMTKEEIKQNWDAIRAYQTREK